MVRSISGHGAVASLWRRSKVAACAVVLGISLVGAPAHATESAAAQAGLGLGSFAASLLYAPVKIIYATGGLIVGGFAYALTAGDLETAQTIWIPSTLGDYVITPSMLTGDETPQFIGRDPAYANAGALAKAGDPEPVDTWEPTDSSAPAGW